MWRHTWQLMAEAVPRPHMVWRVASRCAVAAGWIFLVAWTPFMLWAYGIIPLYQLSLVVSVVCGGLSLAFCWHEIYTASHRAAAAAVSDTGSGLDL